MGAEAGEQEVRDAEAKVSWKVQSGAQVGKGRSYLGRRGVLEALWPAHPSSRRFPQGSRKASPVWVLLAPSHQSCWQRGQSLGKTECHQPPRPRVEAEPVSDPRSTLPERALGGTGRGSAPPLNPAGSSWSFVIIYDHS